MGHWDEPGHDPRNTARMQLADIAPRAVGAEVLLVVAIDDDAVVGAGVKIRTLSDSRRRCPSPTALVSAARLQHAHS